jgi:D-glycero-D-manno-heptose 1,7-bisphosphate phosphatase
MTDGSSSSPSSPSSSASCGVRRAVFLDRDGVLNRDSDDFIKTADELELLPGVPEAVARLNQAGFVTVVVTNQSGIGRGLFQAGRLTEIHDKLTREIGAAGGQISGIYHCPHRPDDGCDCRKPALGMVLQAAREHDLDPSGSFFVGDKLDDIVCGQAAGCRTVLVLSGKTRAYDPERINVLPDHVAPDLPTAVDWILAQP